MLYFETERGLLYNEDCRKTASFLQNDDIDLVVTSPPYNVGIPYDTYDDLLFKEEYFQMIEDVFKILFTKLKKGGRICVNVPYEVNFKDIGDGRQFMAAEHWFILKKIGYKWAGLVDLDEENPHLAKRSAWGSWLSPSAPYIYNPKECILLAYKGQWKRLETKGSYFNKENKKEFMKFVAGAWPYRAETKKYTEANYSLDIPMSCLKILTCENDIVYDPFMGSGTTAIACEMMNRNWIGSELSKNYCEVARKRITEITKKDLFFNEKI
jgi:site-specific DNA-methyltransferase (adenine-specific)